MASNAANNSGNPLSKDLTAPFIPTSHIPFPSPLNVTSGNIVENLKFFKLKWSNYLVATGTQALPETVKKSLLLTAIGEDCLKLYQNFEIKPEDCETADSIWRAVERNLTPVTNIRRQRAMFNMTLQRRNEPYDVYFIRLRKLIAYCGYGENEDEMLLDKIIYSINDFCFRKTLWMDKDITLAQAIERCKSKEYVDLQNTDTTNSNINENKQNQIGVGNQQQQQQQQQNQQNQQNQQQQRKWINKKQADRNRNWKNNREGCRERNDSVGSLQNRRRSSSLSSQPQQQQQQQQFKHPIERSNQEQNKNLAQDQTKQDGLQGLNTLSANMQRQQQNTAPIKRPDTITSPQIELSDLPEIPTDLRIPPPPYEEFARTSPLVVPPQKQAALKPMEAPKRVEHPLMQSSIHNRYEEQWPVEHRPLPSVNPQQHRYQQHDQPTNTYRQPMQSTSKQPTITNRQPIQSTSQQPTNTYRQPMQSTSQQPINTNRQPIQATSQQSPRTATPVTASMPRAGPSGAVTQPNFRCQSCGQIQSSLLEHSYNRSLCLARGHLCKKCGLLGHFEESCTRIITVPNPLKEKRSKNCVLQ